MSESKEKLIQLFKNCCGDKRFEKSKYNQSVNYESPSLIIEESPFEMDKSFERMMKNFGISKFDISKNYSINAVERNFTFPSKPPLVLATSSVRIKYVIDENNYVITPEEIITSIETYEELVKKSFLFFKYNKKKKNNFKFKIKTIKMNEDLFKKILNMVESMNDRKSEIYFDRSPVESLIVREGHYSNKDVDQLLVSKKINSFRNTYDLSNENLFKLSQEYNFFQINGAILMMGEVWTWLSLSEYKELEKLYTDSIKKSHLESLDDRILGKF